MDNQASALASLELKLMHANNYSAKVTDKESKQLYIEDGKVVAKKLPSNNKDTLDIHVYSMSGTIPKNFVANSNSPSILKKIMEDARSKSFLEKLLGDPKLISNVQKILDGSELLVIDSSASQSPLNMVMSLSQVTKMPVALNFTGTNRYLAVGEPSSVTLQEKATKDLEIISGSNSPFIFWQDLVQPGINSFETSMHKDFYICTSQGDSTSPVELRTGPELQKAISEFLVSE